jgi:hypothetical protein
VEKTDVLACPKCGNRLLRREFDGRLRWQEFKCLSILCRAVFAIYDVDGAALEAVA